MKVQKRSLRMPIKDWKMIATIIQPRFLRGLDGGGGVMTGGGVNGGGTVPEEKFVSIMCGS
jgi:hypothetical protein